MKKWYSLWGILLSFCLEGGAQTLTLQQYREKVLSYNQDIKQTRVAVDAALYSLKSIRTGFFPRMDVSGNYSWQFERVEFMQGTDLKHDNYNAEVGAVQNVYAGGALRTRFEAAKIREAIARLAEFHTLDNIVYAADVNYWTTAANRDLCEISARFVQIVGELFQVVEKRFKEGAISKTDVLMVESRLKEAELQLTTSETNYKTALQALNIMMGSTADAEVILTDSVGSDVLLPVRYEEETALRNRADYQIALQDIELARLQTRLVKADYLPQLALGIKEKWGTTLINIDGDSRFSTIAFANLNIPVFYWGERRQNVRISRIEEQTRELERSKLADQVSLELNNAWTTLTEALKKIEIVNSSLEIARNNLLLNTFSYNEGKLPIIDVLSAQVTWLQAFTSVVSVHYRYKIALADYEKALGHIY